MTHIPDTPEHKIDREITFALESEIGEDVGTIQRAVVEDWRKILKTDPERAHALLRIAARYTRMLEQDSDPRRRDLTIFLAGFGLAEHLRESQADALLLDQEFGLPSIEHPIDH